MEVEPTDLVNGTLGGPACGPGVRTATASCVKGRTVNAQWISFSCRALISIRLPPTERSRYGTVIGHGQNAASCA